jgi:hypothetical protein
LILWFLFPGIAFILNGRYNSWKSTLLCLTIILIFFILSTQSSDYVLHDKFIIFI